MFKMGANVGPELKSNYLYVMCGCQIISPEAILFDIEVQYELFNPDAFMIDISWAHRYHTHLSLSFLSFNSETNTAQICFRKELLQEDSSDAQIE